MLRAKILKLWSTGKHFRSYAGLNRKIRILVKVRCFAPLESDRNHTCLKYSRSILQNGRVSFYSKLDSPIDSPIIENQFSSTRRENSQKCVRKNVTQQSAIPGGTRASDKTKKCDQIREQMRGSEGKRTYSAKGSSCPTRKAPSCAQK